MLPRWPCAGVERELAAGVDAYQIGYHVSAA
ncbi:MAG: hypothetical protein RLZZ450_691 [Pseudomonadota bacterium]|jgi:hypothetical protein